jgi:hypothetical protein
MIGRIIFTIILVFILTSCGAAPAATHAPAATEAPATAAPTEAPATEAAATEAPQATEPPAFQAPGTQGAESPALPAQTDTPLPTLELPTEGVNAPAQMVWDGAPTYLGESTPGYYFRVSYDPDLWALTTDQFGFPALAHRQVQACVISVTSGRGLPANMDAEHDILTLGKVTFDVSKVFENGALKFVTYTGGDGTIITGFAVSFEQLADECLLDAETVLSTLRSVPVSQATPQP